MNTAIENLNKNNVDNIISVWKNSVAATHNFLTEDDIKNLSPAVKKGISEINILVGTKEKNTVTSFMGIENEKIEMLFIEPSYIGKGLGRKLVKYAIENYRVKYVDVNEQNKNAFEFYKHMNFQTYKRSETDGMGNPFPILHMKLKID